MACPFQDVVRGIVPAPLPTKGVSSTSAERAGGAMNARRQLITRLLPLGMLVTLRIDLAGQPTAADPLVLSKEGTGPILAGSLALSLRAHTPCDETQVLIPDGSRLVSDAFTLAVDGKGRGTFRGAATVLSPDGQPLLHVLLQGLAGLPA